MPPMMLVGYGIVAFVDIALGLIIAHALGWGWRQEPTVITYGLGVFFALLPDADVALKWLADATRLKRLVSHRQILHYPLVLVPIGLVVYQYHPFTAWLLVLSVGAHFVHDSIGNIWGIQWFWPFSSSHVEIWLDDSSGRKRTIQFRSHGEVLAICLKFPDIEAWVAERYLCLSSHSVRAVLFLAGAIALAMAWR